MEAKYTDVRVELDSPFAAEFAHARAPIPALGGIGRFYVMPNISITGEVTAFKIPDSIDSRYAAHYVDVDIYGTLNFHQQHRRAGRLPGAQRRLSDQDRHRRGSCSRALLRGRAAY